MNFKVTILLTTFALYAHAVAEETSQDNTEMVETKGKVKKFNCVKTNQLTVCDNATVGGNLTVNENVTVAGSEVVDGTLDVGGLITAAVGLTATTGDIVATAGNVSFDPLGITGTLNAIGSLETIGARMIWASVAADGTFDADSGFSGVTNTGAGEYSLTFETAFPVPTVPVITVSPVGSGDLTVVVATASSTGCTINTYTAGTLTNEAFNVIAIGPQLGFL